MVTLLTSSRVPQPHPQEILQPALHQQTPPRAPAAVHFML